MLLKKSDFYNKKQSGYLFFFILCCLLYTSCGGGSVTTLPEAPPPYPNFPVPYEPCSQQPVPDHVYGHQQQGGHQTRTFSPTESNPQNSNNNSWRSSPNALTQSPNYARFTVHANANLWLLVQDSNGNELDWLKLKEGEKVPLSHIGALTLTCSSGQDIEIYSKDGKKLDIPESSKAGISIIRLN